LQERETYDFLYPQNRVGPAIKRVILEKMNSLAATTINETAKKGIEVLIVLVGQDNELHVLKKVKFRID
jgi:hypothetical protein